MNRQEISNPTQFSLVKSGLAISCPESSYAPSHATSNSQVASSAEAEYLHLAKEAEASETSEGSDGCIRRNDDGEYNGLLTDKGSVLAIAANAARKTENQVCSYSGECWSSCAAGLTDGLGMSRYGLGHTRKRRRDV